MGLPLFISPVESDIGRKSHKTASTSPPRSHIRRLPYPSGRQSAHRNTRLLEHIQNRRPLPRAVANALNSENVSTEMVSAAEYIRNGSLNDVEPARPEQPQDVRDPRRPTRMLRMDQRFGNDWRDRDWEHPQQDLDADWWVVEHRLWGGRARLTRLGSDLSRMRSHTRTPQAGASIPGSRAPHRIGSSRVSPLSLPWNSNMVPWSPEPSRRETNDDMNGLGDRMRSVSPEGWDTLLTTLTPDPQPPSANSSFVSTVASQHAGASSSNTSLSEQLRPTEAAAEQPCEPGQDISDGENEEGTRTRAILRGPPRAMNPVRFNVPEYNTNGLLDMSATQRINEARDHRLNRARLNRARRLQEIPEDLWPRTNHGEERDGWVGQLSVGMSDDEQINSRSQLNREDSATSGNTGPTVDEELSGWQRIVRELAVRDDIPDEWWAEAGLSRTLTRDRL